MQISKRPCRRGRGSLCPRRASWAARRTIFADVHDAELWPTTPAPRNAAGAQPASGADRGGRILYLPPGVAHAPPRPLNGLTLCRTPDTSRIPHSSRSISSAARPRTAAGVRIGASIPAERNVGGGRVGDHDAPRGGHHVGDEHFVGDAPSRSYVLSARQQGDAYRPEPRQCRSHQGFGRSMRAPVGRAEPVTIHKPIAMR